MDYDRIAAAIRFLEERRLEQPNLDEAAAHVGLSPAHFQRLFKRWAGVSPKRFLQFLGAEHARRLLQDSHSTLEVADEVGLSGTGRLHDLLVTVHAVTPGQVQARGEGLQIRHGTSDSPFGPVHLGITDRGVCSLQFADEATALQRLQERWPKARLARDPQGTNDMARRIFQDDERPPLHLHGTNFQLKVWEALLRVPAGRVTTYGRLAQAMKNPEASRAVGAAVGANVIGYLIPCHRVLREGGALGGFRWGEERKRLILAREWAAATALPAPCR